MKRRRLVLLVSAAVLAVLGIAFVGAILFVTRTDVGHEQVRRVVASLVANRFPGGKVYIGKVGGNLLNQITIDSVEIREAHTDEVFLRTGRISLSYDPRDVADYRIFIRRMRVEHPYVHFVRHENEVWNFKEIFASTHTGPPAAKDPSRRGWGDYFVVDSTSFRDGTFLLTLPWHPDETLRGAARDSSIRVHLNTREKAVTRRADGFGRTYAWRNGSGLLAHARLADPDSDRTAGQEFRIATLSVDEYEPTFKFRRVTGDVRRLADSVWFALSRFDMPASTGTGRGKVWWGSSLPVRYDIAVHGDSVSLDDVNWVYPTLPHTGGGTLDLLIKNDPKNLHVVDFHLKDMDVRSTRSHLTGDMSFGTGAPLLLVRNVNVRADPVDFDLLTTLSGKPFPVDWRGQLFGTVKARGGPLTHFYVDDARGTFRDAHVRGAESRFSGHGELDILRPAYTEFHHFDVDVGSLDLRTVEYLYPAFPRLGGVISGTATLDSSYLDVRFSDAHVSHQDGAGEPSRISGSGRVTYANPFMIYDVALEADPLSLTMLSRSPTFAALPPLGLFSGPIHAKGSSPDLEVSTSLQGPSGALTFDGRVDIDSVGGYGARGRGQFNSVNLASLLAKPTLPAGKLSGHYDVDVVGATPATLQGTVAMDFERTVLDDIRVRPSAARLRFAGGQMKIDSLDVRTDAFTATASGGIGLPQGRPDSLRFSLTADSLGGLRPFLASARDTTPLGAIAAAVDSLSGMLSARGTAVGTMDSFSLGALVEGSSLYVNKDRAQSLTATVDMRNLPSAGSAGGIVVAKLDSVSLGGIALDTIGGEARFGDLTHARYAFGALLHNGPSATTTGSWTHATSGGDEFVVDSLGLAVGEGRWRLDAPSRLTVDSSGVRIDSLLLRNADSASIALGASVPETGAARVNLRATHVPLRDIGILAQVADTLAGVADATVSVTGTKEEPSITADAMMSAIRWRSVDVDRVTAGAQYRDRRVTGTLDVIRRGREAVSARASLPANVTLFSVSSRNDSISANIRADSADLAMLKAIVPGSGATTVTGLLTADVQAGGTWAQPVFGGRVDVRDGSVKIPQAGDSIGNINGSAVGVRNAAGEDSISVNLQASTDGRPIGQAVLTGYMKNVLQSKIPPTFALELSANQFHALNKRSLADLYVTTTEPLRLLGTTRSSVLTGDLLVNRGSIFLADREIARKQAVEIIPDTVTDARATRSMFSTLLTNLVVRDVGVTLGEDVRLRSAEANVRLAGSLSVVPSTDRSRRTSATTGLPIPTLDLEGTLSTVGGTYNLNLGLVQREFQVLSNGTVAFDGAPQNPLLDIKAQYNVRRQGDRDLGVIVNLHGRLLPYPVIDFSSTADYEIAQSDLVSYLLIGRAGFDYGASPQATQVLSSFLAPSLSALASDRLRQSLGGWLDVFQFQLGSSTATSPTAGSTGVGPWQNYLYGSTIGAEKQFKNIFLNVNTGFCQFSNSGQSFNPATSFGAKAEYRFNPMLSTKLAYDPPTASRICGQANIIGLVPTPGQFSLSLSHTWRF